RPRQPGPERGRPQAGGAARMGPPGRPSRPGVGEAEGPSRNPVAGRVRRTSRQGTRVAHAIAELTRDAAQRILDELPVDPPRVVQQRRLALLGEVHPTKDEETA